MIPSLHGPRDGATYTPADKARLNCQATDVWAFMRDGRWHTLREISAATNHPEASISARLRDYRKERYGRHTVERIRVHPTGVHVYRLVPNREVAA
jgi:hypothetical protein